MKEASCTYLIEGNYVQMAYQVSVVVGLKGYGGKITAGQTPRTNAVEEIWEETGGKEELRIYKDQEGGIHVRPEWLTPIGLIDFYNGTETEVPFGDPSFRVYFFLCHRFIGKAVDTIEMKDHQLFNFKLPLPIKQMVPGDELIIPRFLSGEQIEGWIRRTKDFSEILGHTLYKSEESFTF